MFYLKTAVTDCGGANKCYAFGAPVNWIVFQPNPLQASSTSTSLTILSPPYVGPYQFTARSILNGVVQLNEVQTFTVNPGPLTVTITPNTTNAELNSNSLALFDIAFTTVTHLPANASIAVTLTGLTVPIGELYFYCYTTGLVAMDVRSIIWERMNANYLPYLQFQRARGCFSCQCNLPVDDKR